MKTFDCLLLFLSLGTGGVLTFEVTGYTGGTVVIKCGYNISHQQSRKYFCKDTPDQNKCSDLIKTDLKNMWERRARFSLYDNTTGRFFTVIFRDLTPEDTGTYHCSVDRERQGDEYTDVDLTIREAKCCVQPISVVAYEGEIVDISCPYPQAHVNSAKFFCQGSADPDCKYSLVTQVDQGWVSNKKLTLHDNRDEQILTVTLKNTSISDSGSYWCGVVMNKYNSLITKVELNVTKSWISNVTEASQTTSSLIVQSFATSSATSSIKPSSSSSSSSAAAVSSSGSSLIIAVSVSAAILFFIILITVIIINCRCRVNKTQVCRKTPNIMMTNREHNTQVINTEAIYDEIKDISLHADSRTSESTLRSVYATAPLPTGLYDNLTFSSTQQTTQLTGADVAFPSFDSGSSSDATQQQPSNPANSTDTVPATTQQPDNPTDPPCYASVQHVTYAS